MDYLALQTHLWLPLGGDLNVIHTSTGKRPFTKSIGTNPGSDGVRVASRGERVQRVLEVLALYLKFLVLALHLQPWLALLAQASLASRIRSVIDSPSE